MKNLVSLICVLCLLLSVVSFGAFAEDAPAPAPTAPAGASKWDGTIPDANADYAFEGEGTKKSPWLIQSAAELAQLAANVRLDSKDTTYGGKFFRLTCDIDLDSHPWLGIGGGKADRLDSLGSKGTGLTYFAGNFDGDYHKIYNLKLAATGIGADGKEYPVHQQGLFGYILGARISNLGIESGSTVLEGGNRVGLLVGVGRCGFRVENCYNKADMTVITGYTSVCVGTMFGLLLAPWNDADSNSEQMTSGVCKDKQIVNCYNTGDLTVTLKQNNGKNEFRIGGIAGQYVGGSPELCSVYNLGNVTVVCESTGSTGTNHCLGGLIGAYLDNGFVENAYFKGKLSFTLQNETDLSIYRLGYLFGRGDKRTTYDVADRGINVGYQALEGSTEGLKAMAEPAEPTEESKKWYAPMDNIVLPLAENSTFMTAPEKDDDKPQQTTEAPTQPQPTTPTAPSQSDSQETPTQPKPNGDAATEAPQSGEKKGCQSSLGAMTVALIGLSALGIGLIAGRKKHD